jgi:hypothetical protein
MHINHETTAGRHNDTDGTNVEVMVTGACDAQDLFQGLEPLSQRDSSIQPVSQKYTRHGSTRGAKTHTFQTNTHATRALSQ